MQRPLDVLGSSTDKRILIKTKFGETITGVLKAFDSHINIWLEEEFREKKSLSLARFWSEGTTSSTSRLKSRIRQTKSLGST